MATTANIDTLQDYYEKLIVKMFGENSAQTKALANIGELFNNVDLSTEQKGEALKDVAIQTSIQYNKDALNGAISLMKQEAESPYKEEQTKLITRQIQGYDDNLQVKIIENFGSLANFAVNASSDTAQDSINNFKEQVAILSGRITEIGDPVTPTPVTPLPATFSETSVTDTTIVLEWTPVVNATSYLVYQDGVLVSTSGNVSYTAGGLTELTKYSFNIKASINGVESELSDTLVVTTYATPIP